MTDANPSPAGEPMPALAAARAPRERLWTALDGFEAAIRAPATGRAEAWRATAAARLGTVRAEWDAHIAATESEQGLFAEIVDRAPRLVHAVERLRAEHGELSTELDEVAAQLEAVHDDAAVDAVHERLVAVVARLSLHRHRGIDLVYEAYNVDVSAGD